MFVFHYSHFLDLHLITCEQSLSIFKLKTLFHEINDHTVKTYKGLGDGLDDPTLVSGVKESPLTFLFYSKPVDSITFQALMELLLAISVSKCCVGLYSLIGTQ